VRPTMLTSSGRHVGVRWLKGPVCYKWCVLFGVEMQRRPEFQEQVAAERWWCGSRAGEASARRQPALAGKTPAHCADCVDAPR